MSTHPSLLGFSVYIGHSGQSRDSYLVVDGVRVPLTAETGIGTLTGVGIAPYNAEAGGLVADDDLVVLLAGELYHRDPLVVALNLSTPGTDAELLHTCVRHYGRHAFRLLNGRFAAVVLAADRLVLATDHAASMPLYLRVGDGGITVATEAKALPPDGEPIALAGTEPVDDASGWYRVRAGTVVTLELSMQRLVGRADRTWSPPERRVLLDPSRAASAVAEALAAAVRTRLADEPPTVVVSGGIDSSALAALAAAAGPIRTVSFGTDAGDEFAAARVVARHFGTEHIELKMPATELVAELPWVVAAAEIHDPAILEYLLPLVALYRRLPGPPCRVLTGYGADIPLGGMHRTTTSLAMIEDAIDHDMRTFDGLNELSGALSGVAGHWSTHPYWDRDVLDLLVSLEPGLKRRAGQDKWVLRTAMSDLLPESTRTRAKLGIHEGSGLTSSWSRLLVEAGVPQSAVDEAKRTMARQLFTEVVLRRVHPAHISVPDLLMEVAKG